MLSGGEQQRVALARALAPRPHILLMDEPFSSLDRGLRERVRDETLSLLRKLGTTVIMVTHDPEEALSAGDRIVLMRTGQIVQTGTGYDLHDRPELSLCSRVLLRLQQGSRHLPGWAYRNGDRRNFHAKLHWPKAAQPSPISAHRRISVWRKTKEISRGVLRAAFSSGKWNN